MNNEQALKERLEGRFGSTLNNVSIARERRMFAEIGRENLPGVLGALRGEFGFDHLSAISGVDLGENFEILYHLFGNGTVLTLRVKVSLSDPKVPTVTYVFPSAESYERELEDLLGVVVDGLKPGRRYPLPDDWPKGQHPLRKNWKAADAFPGEQ